MHQREQRHHAVHHREALLAAHHARIAAVGRGCSRGSGTGSRLSQYGSERSPGSCEIRLCRCVVPVRGSPAMMIGRSICSCAISGWRANRSSMRSRFASSWSTSAARRDPPERGEVGVARERLEQHAERLAKARIAVVGQAGALASGREQILQLERRRAPHDRTAERVQRAQRERQPRPARSSMWIGRHWLVYAPRPPARKPRDRNETERGARAARSRDARAQLVSRHEPADGARPHLRRSGDGAGAGRGLSHRRGAQRALVPQLLHPAGRSEDADRLPGGPDPRRAQLHHAARGRDPARRGDLPLRSVVLHRGGRTVAPAAGRGAERGGGPAVRGRDPRRARAPRARDRARRSPLRPADRAAHDRRTALVRPRGAAAARRAPGCARRERCPTTWACTRRCSPTHRISRCSSPRSCPIRSG